MRIRLLEFPFPSTLTILASSLFDFDCLAIVQICGTFDHERVAIIHASQYLDIISKRGTQGHGAAFEFAVTHQEHNRFSVLLAHR
jgi:hypothetical protein